mmetsp:Transcript_9877/g.19584  ORF Transcript_9877/g.19584 Transcript_9877/m.19584 type:complete len:249 (-) Transcript_9877:3964-4710(-)
MMPPNAELSDVSTANSSSLAEAKRIRQQIQRDAQLLENRIKLLTKEEERVWKRIEDTRKHTQKVNEAYERHAEKIKAQLDFRQMQAQRIMEAKDNINRMKVERSKDRQQRYHSVMQSKHQAAQEVREMKSNGYKYKSISLESQFHENMRRTSTIKQDLAQATGRVSAFHQQRLKEARDSYTRKIEEEEKQKQETHDRILTMEALETELIARLQNTQHLQQKAYSELEKALNRNRQTSARTEPTKLTPL